MLTRIHRLLLGAVFLAGSITPSQKVAAQPVSPVVIRVGVVAFEDFEAEFQRWHRVFSQFQQKHDATLKFELAVGSYGDLLHWMEKGFVDLAVLTPGVFSEYFRGMGQENSAPRKVPFEYLATDGLPPATSKWATEARQKPGFHFRYHSVCVVAANSKLKTFDDVIRKSKLNQVEYLFVNPLSASGRMLPEYVLRKRGGFSAERVRYTYSHTESLRLVGKSGPGKERIAFVWDDALAAASGIADQVRKIPVPLFDQYSIPHNVIVMRTDHPDLEMVRSWLVDFQDSGSITKTRYVEDWKKHYSELDVWYQVLSRTSEDHQSQPVSMDEIGQVLLHSARSQPMPPRLAVVLSGGGAKCSYQVGAVCALEEKLGQLRQQNPGLSLDIDLVVGTSGGAINAVPIAFGVTSTKEGRRDFQRVWQSLDQRDIVVPSWPVRVNIGLWFALLEVCLLLWLVKRFVRDPSRRAVYFYRLVIGVALVHAAIAYLPYAPWDWLGPFHLLHHAWLWLTFGMTTMCWSLLMLGFSCWLIQAKKIKQSRYLMISRRQATWIMTVCLLGLPMVQLVTLLCFQTTLSGGKGIEQAIAQGLPSLISTHLKREEKPVLDLDAELSNADRLQVASKQLINGKQLQRDLVITANCIEKTDQSLPTDLYFFAAANRDQEAPFQQRGISFYDYPTMMLDVVIGSGTIFPVFPARKLLDFPEKGESVELIDGGFAHNSPVEAAVLWGATHIVLVEATPPRALKRKNFFYNASAAFVHLHKQTQLVDVRSKQQVVVFTLQPKHPHICVLDFAGNLIKASMERGYRDAQGKHDGKRDRDAQNSQFQKELGEPVFTQVQTVAAQP
ncbi:MAG: patatin-like phospholipase family protein [Pirellulaceae bacterium]